MSSTSEQAPVSVRPVAGAGQSRARLLALTLGLLVACDLLARLYLSSRQGRLDAEIATQYPPGTYVTSFAAKQDYRFINLYTMNPKRGGGPEYHFDEFGFRQDRHRLGLDAKPGFKHVWMFGGSTTMGLGLRESETITARLNDALEAAKSEWRVINLGQGGFTTAQEHLLLTELLASGHRPDAIVCYDGINELPFEGVMDQTGYPGWEKQTPKSNLLLDVQGAESARSLTLLTLTRWTVLDDFMAKVAARASSAKGLPAPAGDRGGSIHPGDNWDVVARRYLVNLNLIRSASRFVKVPSLFFFQPVMQYEDHWRIRRFSDYETSRLVPQMASNEWRRREALLGSELQMLRAALAPDFHDIHDLFRGHDAATLYADPRHPNGDGTKLIAERILVDLRRVLAEGATESAPR